jgi:hypothetical protein
MKEQEKYDFHERRIREELEKEREKGRGRRERKGWKFLPTKREKKIRITRYFPLKTI